jgi:hypothetical protein
MLQNYNGWMRDDAKLQQMDGGFFNFPAVLVWDLTWPF